MTPWRMFIPTRDSARYIGVFFEHYRQMDVDPLYIVDGRSTDGTADVLRKIGADVHVIEPSGDFGLTEMVQAACTISQATWILRLDDDEFPTRAMMKFVARFAEEADPASDEVYLFNREWVKLCNRSYSFFRQPRYISGEYFDTQRRLFRNRNLRFDHQIHTVGIETTDRDLRFAPLGCFLTHFDAVLKSPLEQITKVRRYEQIAPTSAWQFADFYLTDLYNDRDAYILHTDGLNEFMPLLHDLPEPDRRPVTLTDAECDKIIAACPKGLITMLWDSPSPGSPMAMHPPVAAS